MTQPPDPFEFLKSLWGPMGLPMAGMVAPTLNASDLEKRIADLKSVENWLNMNLGVLRMTIQGLEMQKSTLAAMQGAMTQATGTGAQGAAAGAVPPGPGGTLADAWWSVLQQARVDPKK